MTKKEKNILNVLKAMTQNYYDLFDMYKRDGDDNQASYYMGMCLTCDSFIRLITDKNKLIELAKIYKVELI